MPEEPGGWGRTKGLGRRLRAVSSWSKNGPLRCGQARDTSKFSDGWCLNHVSPSKLIVLFRSPLEAHMAHRALIPDAQRDQGVIQEELRVNGSALAITWTAEDLVLCRISISFFRDQLSLVIQNIQRPGPPPP
uniref:L antigen family member 3 n=1 Tax=Phocoena sinus TaxID=42100 RepID=A0A8C9EEX1_PHOSS